MFTPSPSSLPSSTMASSMLIPTRMWIGLAESPARRSSSRCSRSMAQRTASTALENSTSTASPATSIKRPEKAVMFGSISSCCTAFQADTAAAFVAFDQPCPADDIGKRDCRQATHHANRALHTDPSTNLIEDSSAGATRYTGANVAKLGDGLSRRRGDLSSHARHPDPPSLYGVIAGTGDGPGALLCMPCVTAGAPGSDYSAGAQCHASSQSLREGLCCKLTPSVPRPS